MHRTVGKRRRSAGDIALRLATWLVIVPAAMGGTIAALFLIGRALGAGAF